MTNEQAAEILKKHRHGIEVTRKDLVGALEHAVAVLTDRDGDNELARLAALALPAVINDYEGTRLTAEYAAIDAISYAKAIVKESRK